jgi:hypothetical protein
MHQLAASMQKHSEIPVTFDGQAPELAFSNQIPRLIVGERYVVPNAQGKEQHGTLTQAVVMGSNAMGIYALDNGQSVIASTPLTEAELNSTTENPTLTIVALAIRQANHIARRMARREL